MDSHSRSASPREPIRPQHRPPSPPSSPAAFDNRAYQHDESDPNHNDSFTSNGAQQNGHTKEPNGETKTLEAVNLELINLTPKNGNAKKKDVEVDMNASNPYDEYFVPVNEHRKYMRGEKLYVTADKRGEKGGCKRPLCWTLLGLVVAAIVAVIVLAATGVLFNNSPTTLEQYNTSISSARALGGIGHDHHDHEHHDHDHEHDHIMPTQPEHGPEPQNDEAHENVTSDENDSSLYVPRTVEGELKIDNEEFTAMLKDPDSNEYKEFVSTFTEGLKRALFDRNTLDYGDNDISIEVVQLREGSVIITYRIHWKPRINAPPSEDLLTPKSLEMKLDNYLNKNDRMISSYHVAEDKMIARPLLDICQINQNDCDHGCEFNERTLDFTCTCPPGLMLDMTNPKKCMSILEGPVDDEQHTHEEPEKVDETPEFNPTTMKSMPEEDKAATEQPHVHEHENTFDWEETHHMMPVTTTESEADVNFSHLFDHEDHEHKTESSIETHNTDEHNAVKSGEETEPKPEPEPTSEPQSEEEPQPSAEPQPAPELEPAAEPKPSTEPEAAPEPEPAAEPKPAAEPEPTPEPEPTAEPQPATEPHPTAEPQPAEEPKIILEPRPAEETHSVETQATEEPQPSSEPQPESETQDESQTDANSNSELKPESESTSDPHVELDLERNEELEHSVHMVQPEIEPTTEPQSNVLPESQPNGELEPQPNAEPEPQPNAEPEPQPNAEPEPQPNAEPDPQPNAEPEPQSNAEPEAQMETEIQTEHESDVHTTAKPQAIETYNMPEISVNMSKHEENASGSTGRALDQENNIVSEENPINMDENEESKMFTTSSSIETTTMRISISEPNIINEPSYEPKPEIISIFNENKEPMNGPVFVTSETNESTTKTNDWLENNTQSNIKDGDSKVEEEKSTESNFPSNLDAIMKYLTPDHEDESESRSFKHIDSEIVSETTTVTSSSKSEENVPINLITKENEVPLTESIGKVEETTKAFVSIFPDIHMREADKEQDSKEENVIETTTTFTNVIHEHNELTKIASEHKVKEPAESATQKQEDTLENESNVTSSIEEAKLLDSRNIGLIETTTMESEAVTEYSIVQHHQGSEEDKQLMDALGIKKHAESNESSSESSDIPNEGMDMITFDAINQLNSRSSKSIETLNKTNSDEPEANDILRDVAITTTESDWLSESVTETNYEEAMNKMEKHDTTETTIAKIDDIMNGELTKDDFEPDYLNNMGSGSKRTEQEEPAYGMVHDYDNEDSRVKRVHTEVTTESIVNELGSNITQEKRIETSRTTNVPFETTTVSEYIYKSVERAPEEETIKQNSNEQVTSVISRSPVPAAPAPVWEESEVDKELAVKELASKENNHITSTHTVMIDEIIVPTTISTMSTTVAPMPTTAPEITTVNPLETTITENKIENGHGNEFETLEARNATQVNNLNVTIYEISSHNSNSTMASPKSTNANSAEYEDHETEMNPFLPEVENNKSLVKKLQEGHDIEQMINETQNENMEEHSVPSEGNSSSDDGIVVISKGNEESLITTTTSSTEGDTSFNELLMHMDSHENATEPPRTNAPEITSKSLEFTSNDENNRIAKAHEKEILPVSTFLMDTDDLDTYKPIATKIESEGNTIRPIGPASVNSDSEFLSVVPIEEERKEEEEALKGNYKKDNIQELNAISDSPKKSDRRTLDETKFDAVINNEA